MPTRTRFVLLFVACVWALSAVLVPVAARRGVSPEGPGDLLGSLRDTVVDGPIGVRSHGPSPVQLVLQPQSDMTPLEDTYITDASPNDIHGKEGALRLRTRA